MHKNDIQQINFKIVFRVIGMLLCMEAFFMIVPFLVSLWYDESDAFAFLTTIGITIVAGGIMIKNTPNT